MGDWWSRAARTSITQIERSIGLRKQKFERFESSGIREELGHMIACKRQ